MKKIKTALSETGEILYLRRELVAVAESATSGIIQNLFSRSVRATDYYQGGISVYNLEQKIRHLNIDFEEGVRSNCVSAEIASQMALGVAELFKTDWGIGFTGYAAPAPLIESERLFGFYAISYRQRIVAAKQLFSKIKKMKTVQENYAEEVFTDFYSLLL